MALASELRLMCVLAHPDDESLGTGGALAKCAAEGVATYLVTATRGERGRFGDSKESPGPEVVGKAREAELLAAATELGLREVRFLDYPDGALDKVDTARSDRKNRRTPSPRQTARRHHIRPGRRVWPSRSHRHQPADDSRDRVRRGSVVRSGGAIGEPHRVSKLYFIAWSPKKWTAYQAALRKLVFKVDGEERQAVPWPDWAITTVIDTSRVWPAVWRAVSCHKTQMTIYRKLEELSEEHQRSLWGTQEFYRVFSGVNGGRAQESDLFEGLR